MTRDEAIKIIATKFHFVGACAGFAENCINAFSELGMLKLDEPKSVNDIFLTGLTERGFDAAGDTWLRDAVEKTLKDCGLKIVSK